jgi:hypothetical protein
MALPLFEDGQGQTVNFYTSGRLTVDFLTVVRDVCNEHPSLDLTFYIFVI